MSDSNPDVLFTHVAQKLGSRSLAYLHLFEPVGVEEAGVSADERLSHLGTDYFRPRFRGTLMANGGYDVDTAEAAVRQGRADLIAFARLFVANPDLPERFARGTSLSRPDPATFYGGGERGYTDYPSLAEQERSQR